MSTLVVYYILPGGEEIEITIIHTNDTHSRVEEGELAGMGFAKISAFVQQERDKNPYLMLLDAGDAFHGHIIANLVKGESIVKIYNELAYDAMVSGNHDFNYGRSRLEELAGEANFPVLAANVNYIDGKEFLEDYVIKEVGGIRVGIIGLSTPETAYKTHPENIKGLVFEDPIRVAKDVIADLENRVDLIIALTHLGLDESSQYTSELLAEKVPAIDLIIDGHSHHALEKGRQVNNTLIVMAGEYSKYVGLVNIVVRGGQVRSKKASLVSRDETDDLVGDYQIMCLIEEIKKKNKEITAVVIGRIGVDLDGSRSNIRKGETNLGNLITDAVKQESDADVVIIHGGGIRDSLEAGQISRGDIINVLPFGNYVVVKELMGSQILEVIEHGVSAYPDEDGRFPQVSGIRFTFDPSRPAGERVVSLKIDGRAVKDDSRYLVATNDFMAAGGDGYTIFTGARTIQEIGGIEEILMKYIEEQKVVSPEIEGRINIVGQAAGYYYKVQSGDTLSLISRKYGIMVSDLAVLNNLKDPDEIYVDQKILIPGQIDD